MHVAHSITYVLLTDTYTVPEQLKHSGDGKSSLIRKGGRNSTRFSPAQG